MKPSLNKLYFTLLLIISFVSLACANSTPAPVPVTAHSPVAPNTDTLSIPAPTELPPPTPTSTPPQAPEHLGYVPLNDDLANFIQVETLEFDPQPPYTLYARFESGNVVYGSTDGGLAWSLSEPAVSYDRPSLHLLAQEPLTPTTLYGLDGETGSLVKSTDGGQNWASINTPFQGYELEVGGFVTINPTTSNDLFVATMGAVYKSPDGGTTWRVVIGSPGPSGFAFQTILFIPSSPETLYALDQERGLYKSVDGGDSWTWIDEEMPRINRWVVVDPANANTLYGKSDFGGLYLSTDGGASWQETTLGLPTPIHRLAIHPQAPTTWIAILADGLGSLYKSEDGGQTWAELHTTGFKATSIRQLVIDPQIPGTLYLSASNFNVSEVFKSTDNGTSWTPLDLPTSDDPNLTAQVSFWAMDAQTSPTLYLGLSWSNALEHLVYKSTDGGQTWLEIYTDVGLVQLTIDPTSPANLYLLKNLDGQTQVIKSTDGGETWVEMGRLPNVWGDYQGDRLFVDPQTPTTLWALNSHTLYQSTSAGGSWQPVEWSLPGEGTLEDFLIDPRTPTTFFATLAGDAGGVYKSTDSGQTWHAPGVGLPPLTQFQNDITAFAIDPATPSIIYLAIRGLGVFRSLDGGENWVAINPEPFSILINTLVLDSTTPNTLYLSTAEGLWVLRPEG